MDNLFNFVDERIGKYLSNSPYIISIPCVVLELLDNEKVKVGLTSNGTELTVPNWSGSPVEVGEGVQLFYKGNILSDRNAYIGASLNKGSGANSTCLQAQIFTGNLSSNECTIAEVDVKNLSNIVLLIFNATIQGDEALQGVGNIKIYIDDEEYGYSPMFSTIVNGYIHLSFTLPLDLSIGVHSIRISVIGNNSNFVSINACAYGNIKTPYEATDNNDYIYWADSNNAYITQYIGRTQYPIIPVSLENSNTKRLESESFSSADVEFVYIPEGIEEIR